MIYRALLVAGVLLAVLPPPAWADSDHGWGRRGHQGHRGHHGEFVRLWHDDGSFVSWTNGGALLRLASGRASAGASDPHVTVSGPGVDTRQATVCSSRPGSWAAPPADSAWVSIAATCDAGQAAGEYRYMVRFTLPSLDTLNNLRLAGAVLVDDTVRIDLNGRSIFTGGRWDAATPFETTDRGAFRSGENALVLVVTNTGGATGLAFAADVTANGAVSTVGTGSSVLRLDDDHDDDRDHDRDDDFDD